MILWTTERQRGKKKEKVCLGSG